MSNQELLAGHDDEDRIGWREAQSDVHAVARILPYVALVAIFAWFGGMKFTAYEAGAIQGLVANSPFIGWVYSILGVQAVSNLIGSVELIAALLIAGRLISPRLSAIGGLLALGTFVVTLSFFFTTPGVTLAELGFPAISVLPGQFLLKDIGLAALALFVISDSLARLKR